MKNLTKMCLILSCVFLVSCNQAGEGTSPAAVPEYPTSDLSGTVSSVINFLNPISSAYADETKSKICTSSKSSNGKVEIYLVDEKGNEDFVCHTSLNKNRTFNIKILKDLIPVGSEIIVKAFYNGAIRESYVNSSATTDVNVDPASTLALPAIKFQRKQGNKINAKKIRIQISKYVENKIGAKLAKMKAPNISRLKIMMENSEEALEKTLFNPDKDSVLDDSFQKFMQNVYKSNIRTGTNGNSYPILVYSDENAEKLDCKINGKIIGIVCNLKKEK